MPGIICLALVHIEKVIISLALPYVVLLGTGGIRRKAANDILVRQRDGAPPQCGSHLTADMSAG
jgi:hypothetical protein